MRFTDISIRDNPELNLSNFGFDKLWTQTKPKIHNSFHNYPSLTLTGQYATLPKPIGNIFTRIMIVF